MTEEVVTMGGMEVMNDESKDERMIWAMSRDSRFFSLISISNIEFRIMNIDRVSLIQEPNPEWVEHP